MSMEFWFRGRLEFRDMSAIANAKQALVEEGCEGHEDNLVGDDDLQWNGTVLTVESRGSMPYSCFEISSCVLRTFAQYAGKGDVVALNVEEGCGERYMAGDGNAAGGECVELNEDEIAGLRREYGWGEED